MLTIGSIYGHGFDSSELERLEKLGFRLRSRASAYSGSQALRFIDFASGPALELIEVEDPDDYLAFVPDGMEPYCPGVSLDLKPGEEAFLGGYEQRFARLNPYRLHVNYDGSSEAYRSGWTYLNFADPVVAGTFIWLTAHDEPRPESERETAHPNSALRLLGLAFELEANALGLLRRARRSDRKRRRIPDRRADGLGEGGGGRASGRAREVLSATRSRRRGGEPGLLLLPVRARHGGDLPLAAIGRRRNEPAQLGSRARRSLTYQ